MADAVPVVVLDRVSKTWTTRPLLDTVTFGVSAGERVGVVGRNGAGKSTLVRLVTGQDAPDTGRVVRAGGVRVVAVAQHDALDPRATVGEVLQTAAAGRRLEADPAGRAVLDGLLGGIDAPAVGGLDRTLGATSGGQRRRVALAAALVTDADLLVLDEPTNHLDLEAIDWLGRHLARRPEAMLLVSHDRWLIEAVCTRVAEVTDGAVHSYDGGYAAYVLARAERERTAEVTEQRRANLVRKELAWLRRGAPARTSKPRYRVEAATALIADVPPPRDRVSLVRAASARLGRTVLELEDVAVARGGVPVLRDLTWRVGPGDRIGVLGANGSGKTTLMRLLLGDDAPGALGAPAGAAGAGPTPGAASSGGAGRGGDALTVTGKVVRGLTVRGALLAQELPARRATMTALEAVQEVAQHVVLADGRELSARQLMLALGFSGDGPATRVGDLSGGERRRLELTRLLIGGPNVLLLDEPTNDIDIDVLTALEDLLDGWPGTLLVVSHDRWFLERVTDVVLAVTPEGRLRPLPGGVEEYLRLSRGGWGGTATSAGAAAGGSAGNATGGVAASGATSAGATAQASAGTTPTPASGARSETAVARAARRTMQRIERRLARLESDEAALHERMAEAGTDYARLQRLDADLRALVGERAALEEEWLEAAELSE